VSNLVGRSAVPTGGWMLDQLPTHLAEDDMFRRFVGLFQALSDTVQHHVDTLPRLGDTSVAPLPMVRFMAGWVSTVGVDPSLPPDRQRELVRGFARLLPWKGTRAGLVGLLELITGAPVVVRDSGGVFPEGEVPEGPRRIEIEVAGTGDVAASDVLAAVHATVPIDVAFELSIAGRTVWPVAPVAPAAPDSSPSPAPPPPPPPDGAVDLAKRRPFDPSATATLPVLIPPSADPAIGTARDAPPVDPDPPFVPPRSPVAPYDQGDVDADGDWPGGAWDDDDWEDPGGGLDGPAGPSPRPPGGPGPSSSKD
jgi:phage tail-like protein